MYILGVTGNFGKGHDASATILKDDKVIAAAEEERFVRYKHAVGLMPERAIAYCLKAAGITMKQVDYIAFPQITWDDFAPRLESFLWYNFGYVPKIVYVEHHLAHAASAYFVSGFDSSLVITLDQAGDRVACAAFRGRGSKLECIDRVRFPDSVGLFAAYITQYLGFRANHDEYKVMGLASYGQPTFDLSPVMRVEAGAPVFDTSFLSPATLVRYPIFPTNQLPMIKDEQYSFMPSFRPKDGELLEAHRDLAASAQKVIEDAMLAYVKKHRQPTDRFLCLAGGVAENSVGNGKIAAAGLFDDIYVACAAGDNGLSLGAALHVATQHGFTFERLADNRLGPEYSDGYIETMLNDYAIVYHKSDNVTEEVADLLSEQNIVAWFQGRMEFGPRALGARSLLADPSNIAMKNRVNRIKKREQFRPFAPSVLEEHAAELFTVAQASPFMSFTLPTTDLGKKQIIGATHVDFTGRLQTVAQDGSRYRRLIEAFYQKTGVPAVLNTSLNSGWEPIVESPDQALAFFFSSEADVLVLHDFIITKQQRNQQAATRKTALLASPAPA